MALRSFGLPLIFLELARPLTLIDLLSCDVCQHVSPSNWLMRSAWEPPIYWAAMHPSLSDFIVSAKLFLRRAAYKSHRTYSFIDISISMKLSLWWNLFKTHHGQGLLDKSPIHAMSPATGPPPVCHVSLVLYPLLRHVINHQVAMISGEHLTIVA